MGQEERFLQPGYIPKREYQARIVDTDGEHEIGRWYNLSGSRNFDEETLTEIHSGREVVVLSEVKNDVVQFSGGMREFIGPELQSILQGNYEPPNIVPYYRLKGRKIWGRLFHDNDSDVPAEYALTCPYGVPQAHDSINFPPATGVTAAAQGAGTIADGTWYAWVVPFYKNFDAKYGVADSALTAANWANLVRSRDFVFGTPSASDDVTLAGGPQGMKVDWTRAIAGLTGIYSIPTGYVVVVGSTNTITDATSKVCAVVLGVDVETATFSAIGATAFGTTPVAADLRRVQTCSISGGTRVWANATETTDYTFDPLTGIYKRVVGGAISAAEPIRILAWNHSSPEAYVDMGKGGQQGNNYRHVRLENWWSKGVDPDTRRPRGIIVDFPKVNFAGLRGDLFTTNPDGFHRPMTFNFKAEHDNALGYTYRVYSVEPSLLTMIDYFSNNILPAAA